VLETGSSTRDHRRSCATMLGGTVNGVHWYSPYLTCGQLESFTITQSSIQTHNRLLMHCILMIAWWCPCKETSSWSRALRGRCLHQGPLNTLLRRALDRSSTPSSCETGHSTTAACVLKDSDVVLRIAPCS
jgi:hypothetical protein